MLRLGSFFCSNVKICFLAEEVPLTVTPDEQTALRKQKAKAKPGRRRKDQPGKRPGKGKGRGKGKGKGTKKKQVEEKAPRKSSKVDGKKGPADHDENITCDKPRRKRKSKVALDSNGHDSKTEKVEKKKIKSSKPSSKVPDHDKLGSKPANQNDDVKFGCSRCRFAAKGCKTCKNPSFRPRGARQQRGDEPVRDVD